MSKILRLEGSSDKVIGTLLNFMGALENPLVYIGDLVQNAIDARATHVTMIVTEML
jgi:hypothetical protein